MFSEVLKLFWWFSQNWRVIKVFWSRIRVQRAEIHRDMIVWSTFLYACVIMKQNLSNNEYFHVCFSGEEISNGDKSRKDTGYNSRWFHSLLASLLHDVSRSCLLPKLHSSNGIQCPLLAGLLQFGNKSLHLRSLQQRLQIRVQANNLQLFLQEA